MRLKPLKQWLCDSCGGMINKPGDGWFEWYTNNKSNIEEGFKIVHHQKACMYDDRSLRKQGKSVADLNLTDVIGIGSLAASLFRIELAEKGKLGKINLAEYIEILRRLHIPYWEEARLYWDEALKAGGHDACDFSESTLVAVIDEYSPKNQAEPE
jgi:hypothetical protein